MGIFFLTSQLIIAKIHKSKQPWFPFFYYTIVTCLIFGASLPDGQVHHLARGRNCPLEIRTPEPRTQDEAKKEMSGRVRRRPRSLRGWQRWQVGLRRKRRPPDAPLVAKYYLGHGIGCTSCCLHLPGASSDHCGWRGCKVTLNASVGWHRWQIEEEKKEIELLGSCWDGPGRCPSSTLMIWTSYSRAPSHRFNRW